MCVCVHVCVYVSLCVCVCVCVCVCAHVEHTTGAKHNRGDEKNMVGLAHSRASR